MAWYDKNKVPEWQLFIEKGYSIEHLLNNKDLIIQELPKAQQLQRYIKTNRQSIVMHCLQMCLQFPEENSSYDRKYAFPTKSIQLITSDLFFSSLSWDKQLIQKYIHLIFTYFSTVDAHVENVNIYHAYFQRLLKMLYTCKVVDKLDVKDAIEAHQGKENILGQLYKHAYKLSIANCLDVLLSIDFIQPLVTVSLDFKKNIIQFVYSTLEKYITKSEESQIAENCLQILKFYFEKAINFMASVKRNQQPLTPITELKIQQFHQIYCIFKSRFNLIIALITKTRESNIRMLAFELLQLNQIMLCQPEVKLKQQSVEWFISESEQLIIHMFSNKINIAYPYFVDWLTLTFSQIGVHQYQIELFCRLKILEKIIQALLSNRNNNILAAKIYQFLKIIFHNIAQLEIITSIQRYKSVNINLISFKLFNQYIRLLSPIQSAIKQFKTINDPLFVVLFNLYKIISQYCRNIDSLFNLYLHIDVCKQSKPILSRIIEFQRQEPCFNVYQRQIAKDLGRFYTDDMFFNQKPTQFTVKSEIKQLSTASIQHIEIPPLPMPTPTTFSPISIQLPSSTQSNDSIIVSKTNPIQRAISKSETTLPEPIQSTQLKAPITSVQQENEEDKASKFGSYMRNKLLQVDQNIQARRSKSRTPTKIKNELKKAKNKWMNTEEEPQRQIKTPFSCQIKEKSLRSTSSPKLSKTLIDCNIKKISLLKVTKNQIPSNNKERILNELRDGRLMGWLKVLKAEI